MRRPFVAGNWKMNGTVAETGQLLQALLPALQNEHNADVAVFPAFTSLWAAKSLLEGTQIALGAQDLFWKERGAYTGQISAAMLLEAGCRWVIVGHSERRGRFGVPELDFDEAALAHFGESDATVNRKLRSARAAGLGAICCVGELLSERQAHRTDDVVRRQLFAALHHIDSLQDPELVFAYEPVWAIGTGETCACNEADRVCGVIREAVGEKFGSDAAKRVRVQYGGSVKPDNAQELLAAPNIDGALVGGASLKAADFAAIVRAALKSL